MNSGRNTNQDEALLNTIFQTILSNLDNEQFGVEELSQQVGMSRSNLHRKLKLLQGKTASQFIREVRLQEALKLLQQDVATTSEIAYRVGFNSTSYFHKCFQDYFGHSPSEIKKYSSQNAQYTTLEKDIAEGKNPQLEIPQGIQSEKTSNPKVVPGKLLFALTLVFLIFVGFILHSVFINQGNEVEAPQTVAVLPFDNLSDSSEQDYLSAGIQDELIIALGKFSSLRVISKTSTLKYDEQHSSAPEIAQALGADLIVTGSVFVFGDSLRVNIQLVQTFPEEYLILEEEYYRAKHQLPTLRNDATQDIITSIRINLRPEEAQQLSHRPEVDPETYRLYLKGMYFLNKSTEEEFQKGLRYLHQAIEKDPADPRAYTQLANGYITLGHGPDPPPYVWKRGKAASLQAIALDSTLAEAYSALASIKLYFEWDWEGAEQAFMRANALNSSLAFNHFHFAWYLAMVGRMEEALHEHKLAKELAPLTPIVSADMGSLYNWVGQYDRAIVEAKQALELDQKHGHAWWVLGNAYALKGDFDQALEAHKMAYDINPVWEWAVGNTYALSGQTEKAQSIVAKIKEGEITSRQAFGLVMIYTSLGNLDEAFHWLEFQPANNWVPWLRTWPGMEPLRQDPRFHQLLDRVNLPTI